ncbi:MAG: TonB-dependent receptor plug domain-containing protein [Armatimonadota bacterium]
MSRLYCWGTLLVFIILLCVPAMAQTVAESDEQEVVVIVTAERTAQPISETISSATVVTAKEIRERGAQNAADAIRIVPGVSIVQNGQVGALATARMRGTSTAQALVLVDGERVTSSAFGASADLGKWPVENISRIEVIRGPVSSLYGSDAIGGVINIITKRPTSDTGDYKLGFGSNDRVDRSITLRGADDIMQWQLSGSVPSYTGTRPNSEYSATDISGKLTFPDANGWDLGISGNVYQDSLGLPGSAGAPTLNDTQWWDRKNFNLSAKKAVAGGMLEIRGYTMNQVLTEKNPDWFLDSKITGHTKAAEMTYRRDIGSHQLVFGSEYRDENYEDIENGALAQDKAITNRALFIQDRMPIDSKMDLVFGARLDDHSTAGNKVTPRAGITREIAQDTRIRASYSAGFRAPSLVELYYKNWGSVGNPELKPEKSKQYELGINTKMGKNDFDLALFTSDIEDQIAWITIDPIMFTGTFENIDKAKQKGIEFSWDRPIGKSAHMSLAYTYIDALNVTKNARISGIPYNQVSLTASRNIGNLNMALTGRWVDDRLFGPTRVPSYAVMDLFFSKKGNSASSPYLVIRNIADKSYDEVAGYPAEGRSVELGMRSSW